MASTYQLRLVPRNATTKWHANKNSAANGEALNVAVGVTPRRWARCRGKFKSTRRLQITPRPPRDRLSRAYSNDPVIRLGIKVAGSIITTFFSSVSPASKPRILPMLILSCFVFFMKLNRSMLPLEDMFGYVCLAQSTCPHRPPSSTPPHPQTPYESSQPPSQSSFPQAYPQMLPPPPQYPYSHASPP